MHFSIKRGFGRRVGTIGATLLGLLLFECCGLSCLAAERRPNFLFIIVDDQSPNDLKIYNPRSILNTPNIERLAAEGVVFDGAYIMGSWVGAVCLPSRTMIMMGRTVWHIPAPGKNPANPHTNNPKLVPPDLPDHTLPAVFNRAGYATMRTCKIGNSYEAANKLFTVRRDATKRGPTDETGSAWHAEQVLEYLAERESRGDKAPFLIYFGFSHPHDPRDGKPELLARYGAVNHTDRNTLPPAHPNQPLLPVNYLPAHPFDTTHMDVRDEVAVSGVWDRRDERIIRNELGREFACAENIDIQIGHVLRRLEEMGELENTYIFYTADNGMALGSHGLQGKQNLYQHTWRVPLIVKGPGIPGGRRVEGNVYLLDVLATLCDLAGIEPPATYEGISFRPVLEGKTDKIREVLYGVYCGGAKPGIRCVKKGDWKLIKYDAPELGVHVTQLFNLAENPHEFLIEHHNPNVTALTGVVPEPHQVSLADDPRYAAKRAEMEALLLAEMRRLDDPYRLWDQPDDGLRMPQRQSLSKE
ncbi:MAG TPA: sulfatase-like hydrolase/transferase [Thermogutta sp.]|nr:sulfatase-like hydrolase/transferase [Thermogutta sp.]